ncbi:unnamed protein product [Blumeria hordei]|uniref:peptidyl-tRNA hydrolase n=2 Tax=Blumeria hordei TaxID=2867405 RepID=A0A383V1N2_BLUHO|nr:peptidyl tRNA hydrolase [Blumeria hordei DH14]SZF05735.1 unnamed protein product [Blumeria hordei]
MPNHLLVCSIGNPAPYKNTLHSAGHTVLMNIARTLGYTFQKARDGSVAIGTEYILWQSNVYMNVSGPAVAKAHQQYRGRLVVLHDDMELRLGQVRVASGQASAKGHNGLKSIKSVKTSDYMRIGIGIGRPISRERDEVAAYVLRMMQPNERTKIEECTSQVLKELQAMAAGV